MPELSIITINRNNADGLKKTIESVVYQTYTDFEYIVIDGNSTDNSVDVIKAYAFNINYWVSEPDLGIYNAMNKGLRKAMGEYCLFLNSGDYLVDSNVLSTVFENNFNEDLIYGDQLIEQNQSLVKRTFLIPEYITFRSFMSSTLPHQCTFIRRSLFLVVGLYNENNKIVSDWEFNVLALFKYNCSLRKIDIAISVYDTNGISSSMDYMEIHNHEKRQLLYKYFPRFMKDYDAMVRLEKSKTFKLAKTLRKLFK
ncbi:MAG: glycosyltransferase family 2 protein [Paludibacter sp.]|nr:glycosyltransferase family 2 protein [Paludibacter sp.]